ncbi:hypothetical protein M3Y98_00196200 [Aphelenchoides besseyi]|nr:hypothetical protein M3Y98_00196200 [Aphelenchoides besseyi]KAI6200256.1 hypothetical protein M3Y96_00714000 [Aphelenchoides besseyi]
MIIKLGFSAWPPPTAFSRLLSLLFVFHSVADAQERLMGGLISTRDIAELTQIATQLAAQTMNANGELLSKPGRPEVQPLSLNARPSELIGQSITNMMQPATEQLARAFSAPTSAQSSTRMLPRAAPRTELPVAELPVEFGRSSQRQFSMNSNGGSNDGMGGLLDLASSFLRRTNGADGQPLSSAQRPMPTLKQLVPNAASNFGIKQGEGCLPFIGEFMQMLYGNCVKQADERTWDTWGKEITNALMGGKIDLLKASKETCRKGAEREQCGQIRRAVSECDILGSIQLASNMQRALARCDEISGIIDQNPMTILDQMSGLVNGEMAQGFLNNFLGR